MKKVIFAMMVLVALSVSVVNAQITVSPNELTLGMVSGSYAVQKVLVLNQNSLSADVVVSSDSWISVYPSQFQLEAGEGKQLICTFLVLSEESPERTGLITFTSSEQKVVLPIRVVDPLIEQRKMLQAQAEKRQAEANKDAEIQRLRDILAQKDKEITSLNESVKGLTSSKDEAVASAKNFQDQLADKDTKIEELNATIKDRDVQIAQFQEGDKGQQVLIAKLSTGLEESTKSYKELQDKVGRLALTHEGLVTVLKDGIKQGNVEIALDDGNINVKFYNFFSQGAVYPRKSADEALTELGKLLKSNLTSEGKITVIAFTDSVDIGKNLLKDYANNSELSEVRAGVVKKILSLRKGIEIDAKQVVAKGEGTNNPVADNKTSEGRAKNRRIEIIITPG